tara:strand:- start:80 stop:868 length:789 start_codon:yes stop_codon:yes gene_type:complete
LKKDIHNNFIKNGSLCIKELKVIKFNGDKEKIDEFLNGQITSDHKQLTNNAFQLSSICNHKGQVIADFIVNKSNDEYRFIINDALKTILIDELSPFIKLHRVEIKETNNIVIGNISTKGNLEYSYCSNKNINLSISVEDHDFKYKDSISIQNWHAANKILRNYFMQPEDIAKFRPVEINYDNLRVSFDKGCYRGQEIVARMKYLGIDRRRFCTIISNSKFKNEGIKVIGPIITINNLSIFNAIIKRDEIEQIKKTSGILEII